MATKEEAVFIKFFSNAAAVANGARYQPDLGDIKRDFGNNFNTIHVLNLHTAQKIYLELDQDTTRAIPIPANGGSLSISHEDGIIFNDFTILNSSGSEAAIGALQVSIGRTGKK